MVTVNDFPKVKDVSISAGLPPPSPDNVRYCGRYSFFLYVDDQCLQSLADTTITSQGSAPDKHHALVVVAYGGPKPDGEWTEHIGEEEITEAEMAYFQEEEEHLWAFCFRNSLIELYQWIPDDWHDLWLFCHSKDHWIGWNGELNRNYMIPK